MKPHTTKEEQLEGARGHHPEHHDEGGGHGHHEGNTKRPHSPVLIEQAGATQTNKLDGNGLRVTIVASRWYENVVHSLVDACSKELLAKGVAEDDLHLVEVAGAFELPFAAASLVYCKDTSHRPDAVICIGCFVNGATHMCETMSHAVADGIMKLNVTPGATPVIFGVLCCDSESQAHSCAEKRSCCGVGEGQKCNHGVSWAQSALEMAHLKRCTSAKKMEHCSCTRCVSRESGESGEHNRKSEKSEYGEHDLCTSCGLAAGKCSCKECVCRVCCNNRGACTSCKSSADNCSCKDCECQVCSSKTGSGEQIEPAIKSATSSTILCGGGCIAAAQRAAAGGCPGCECPAGGCPCTKCGCPICGPNQSASNPTPCCGGNKAGKRATAGNCPACGCPGGNCPCTGCKCPTCKST